eukprot:gene7051-11164_t
MGAEWSSTSAPEKRPSEDAVSAQPCKKSKGDVAHPHPGDLRDLTLLSSTSRGTVAYAAKYTAGNGDADVAEETQQAVMIISRLDPESAGSTVVSQAGVSNVQQIFRNSKFSKFDLDIPDTWRAEVICPASDRDIQKHSEQTFRFVRETPEMYAKVTKPFIDAMEPSAIEIVKDYKWNDEAKVTAMHVLGMPKEKGKLKSIRDLRGEHIPLLKSIRAAGLAAVEEKYGIQANTIRCYFHYLPTFYHLHVHFDHIAGGHGGHNVAKAVLLDDVIDALEVDGNHFSKASLTFQAGDVRDKKILAALDA